MSELWHTFLHLFAYFHLTVYCLLAIHLALTWKSDPPIRTLEPPERLLVIRNPKPQSDATRN